MNLSELVKLLESISTMSRDDFLTLCGKLYDMLAAQK